MLFIFSTTELIRNLWQLKTAVFLHWCLIRAVPLLIAQQPHKSYMIKLVQIWNPLICRIFYVCFTKKSLNKISNQFLATTKLFTGRNIPIDNFMPVDGTTEKV